MAVEIKELIVKGFVNGEKKIQEKDIVKIINVELSKRLPQKITEDQKQEIIEACIYEFKNYIDHKINY